MINATNIPTIWTRAALSSATALASIMPFMSAPAAANDAPAVLEQIIVTAQKREESLQRAPLAVSAVSQAELDRAGVVDSTRLSDIAPNVNIGVDNNRDALFITIRGVSGTDTRNAADPTTAFHIDGVNITRMSGANAYFYDLERVEILRGPQGTLYGRNATTGVVNVISNKPDYDFSGSAEVTVGNYNLLRTRGHLNLPVIDGKFAMRASFLSEDRDGYRDNGPLVSKDGDDADDVSGRLHMLFQPTDRLEILLTGEVFRKRGVGRVNGFIPFDGNPNPQFELTGPKEFALDTQGFRKQDDISLRWQVTYDFDFAELTYLGGWREHERETLNDLDGTDLVDSTLAEDFRSVTQSHEVRLASSGASRFDWIAGFFYFDETIDSIFNIQIPTVSGLGINPGFPFTRLDFDFNNQDQSNEGFAIFGNGRYQLTDSIRLTGGLRYNDDSKSRTGEQIIRRLNSMGPPPLSILPQEQEADFDKVTWKVGVDWQASEDVMVYASVGTGYKAGGFNRGENLDIFGPESITAFEVGAKTTFADNRIRLNTSAFYYDYEDLQQAQVTPLPDGTIVNTTVNAAEASIWGLELEIEALPYDRGRFSLVAGYLNAQFDDFPNIENPLTGAVEDLSNNDLILAPEFSFTAAWEPYSFDIGDHGRLTPAVQVHVESKSYLTIQNIEAAKRGSFSRTNVQLRYEDAEGRYNAELYVQNLENNDILSFVQSGTAVIGPGGGPSLKGLYAAPRTYGFRIGAKF